LALNIPFDQAQNYMNKNFYCMVDADTGEDISSDFNYSCKNIQSDDPNIPIFNNRANTPTAVFHRLTIAHAGRTKKVPSNRCSGLSFLVIF